MKIRKMTAHFGTLKGESLVLGEGLNVITAPNERGKSTWCAFLKAMLYGVDTSKRASAGVLPDKTRYAAWDGSAMRKMSRSAHSGSACKTASSASFPPLRSTSRR